MPTSRPTPVHRRQAKPRKSNDVPAYVRIAQNLTAFLKSGALPPGSLLPAERLLCHQFGVSRMTLRHALEVLEREGLIESHRGRGTFVARSRFRKQQQELKSFTEEILARGGVPKSQLLSFKTIAPDGAAAEFFHLTSGDSLYEIRRLRLSDGVPLAVETVRIPQRVCPGLDGFDLAKNSLYVVLEQNYGITLEACVEEISAELAKAPERKLLELSGPVAVLVVNRRTRTNSGQPIEFTKAIYRGDLYSAVVHSQRKKR